VSLAKVRIATMALAIGAVVLAPQARADFGDADFPSGLFTSGPKSYHDAWCRKIKKECRVRFQGPAMWVEGQGGITIDQFVSYRMDVDGLWSSPNEYYNYITYKSDDGSLKEALFMFAHEQPQNEFTRAFLRWKRQKGVPIPNYRFPASQGPQDTHGRDKSYGRGNNPYTNPPITDWKEKTTP